MRFSSIALLASVATASRLAERSTTVCGQIAGNITGTVLYPTDLLTLTTFEEDIEHYMTSSDATPTCVVEVANAQDVSEVLKIVGANKTPFAVKSGGHASNPGFSSTTGVFISLVNIDQITLSADNTTLTVGLGNIWSDVYKALDGTGLNVVGGRVEGPGTGGFTLGGGYSWLTDQYGLTCDTVVSYELVLPNGTIVTVDAESQPDLNFALKGGLNRFGIVTSIVYKTVPQGDVYGGLAFYSASQNAAIANATYEYQLSNTDPKAQIITTFDGGILDGPLVLFFYDGSEADAEIAFAPFADITPEISSVEAQSFYSFSTDAPSDVEAGNRGAFATMSTTTLTLNLLNAVYNESSYYGEIAALHSGILISYDTEPFKDYGQYATDSAYPHSDSQLPLNLYFSWSDEADDAYWRGVMQTSINYLSSIAEAEGILYPVVYPNYALSTYSGAQLYGDNAPRLLALQKEYDPNGVMELAGGFSFS